jgi:hypothetical protein
VLIAKKVWSDDMAHSFDLITFDDVMEKIKVYIKDEE